MPGRGHGRLIGPSPNSGPKMGTGRGRGRGRGQNFAVGSNSSRVVDDFVQVPFYTNQFGKISKAQYDKNKTNPKLHPDDAGLGEFYVGSMPWHVRNQGRIWVPREDRPNRIPIRSKRDCKVLKLPKNEDPIAQDFDTLSDEVEMCQNLMNALLWNKYVQHADDPKDPSSGQINFFFPHDRPIFPDLPKGCLLYTSDAADE